MRRAHWLDAAERIQREDADKAPPVEAEQVKDEAQDSGDR